MSSLFQNMELIFILFFQMFMGCYIPKYHSFYLLMGRANAAKFFFYIIKLIIEIKLRFTRLCLGFFSRCCDKILGQKQLKETRCIWLPAGQTEPRCGAPRSSSSPTVRREQWLCQGPASFLHHAVQAPLLRRLVDPHLLTYSR